MKKTICIILCALFLTGLLASCADAGTGENTTAPSADVTTAEPVETELRSETLTDDLDYNLAEVIVLSRDSSWVGDEVDAEDINGETVNDAIYRRSEAVEKYLNVVISNTKIAGGNYDVTEKLRTACNSGTTEFNLIANSTYSTIMYTGENLLRNLKECSLLDLEAVYWSQGFNESASIGQGQYLCTGAIALSIYRYMFVTFINQEIMKAHNVASLFDTVNEGKWTLDYQIQLATDLYSDTDGVNGVTEGDTFGFITNYVSYVDPYWSSCNNRILTKDADNWLVYSIDVERLANTLEKVIKLYHTSNALVTNESTDDGVQNKLNGIFAEDRAAMATMRLASVEGEYLRDMKSEYGIIPVPKLDEAQEKYYTFLHDQFTSFGISSTVKNDDELQMLGAVLECMALQSYLKVVPEFYNVALKGKYLRNSASWDMLDKIYDSVFIDAGVLYTKSLSSVHQQPRTIVKSGVNNTTAYFKAMERVIKVNLKTLQDAIAKIQ